MTTSTLTPTYELTVGSQRWTEQVIAVRVELDPAPMTNRLRAALPAAAPFDAVPGDQVTLRLDGGEGSVPVFTGELDAVRRGVGEIVVRAVDAGAGLDRFRPAVTFEQVSASSVIRSLCDEIGVTTAHLDEGVSLAYYAADPSRSALGHIARVAAWGGALVNVTADGAVESRVVDGTQPERALRYGRELVSLEQASRWDSLASIVVAGESGAGDHSDPKALRPVTDFFAGNRPDGPSAAHRWSFEPALRTTGAAATAGAARGRDHRARSGRGALRAFLVPGIRPGAVLDIQDVPDGLARGPFVVDRVTHRLELAGATTSARLAKGGEAFDPLALLGSLAGGLL